MLYLFQNFSARDYGTNFSAEFNDLPHFLVDFRNNLPLWGGLKQDRSIFLKSYQHSHQRLLILCSIQEITAVLGPAFLNAS